MKANKLVLLLLPAFLFAGLAGCAQESTNTYTITYNRNGGSGVMAKTTAKEGESVTLRKSTFTGERSSDKFLGWSLSKEGEVVYEDEATIVMPAEDITLYANYDWFTITVYFDGNGADSGSVEPIKVRPSNNSCFRFPENNYVREGCEFVGWSRNKWDPDQNPYDCYNVGNDYWVSYWQTEDITFYANYVIGYYIATVVGPDYNNTIYYDIFHETAVEEWWCPSYDSNLYDLLGYTTVEGGTTAEYELGQNYFLPAGGITLYPVLQPKILLQSLYIVDVEPSGNHIMEAYFDYQVGDVLVLTVENLINKLLVATGSSLSYSDYLTQWHGGSTESFLHFAVRTDYDGDAYYSEEINFELLATSITIGIWWN